MNALQNLEISMGNSQNGQNGDKNLVIEAARATLTHLPDSDELLADLTAQLAQATATLAQLRADARGVLASYRAWRREARCGRAVADNVIPLHPVYMKQLRRIWATYRLGQLLLRDMSAMAGLRARQRALSARVRLTPGQVSLQPLAAGTPANDDTQPALDQPHDGNHADGISYDELELRYGPVLAQRLYDEIQLQVALERSRGARH